MVAGTSFVVGTLTLIALVLPAPMAACSRPRIDTEQIRLHADFAFVANVLRVELLNRPPGQRLLVETVKPVIGSEFRSPRWVPIKASSCGFSRWPDTEGRFFLVLDKVDEASSYMAQYWTIHEDGSVISAGGYGDFAPDFRTLRQLVRYFEQRAPDTSTSNGDEADASLALAWLLVVTGGSVLLSTLLWQRVSLRWRDPSLSH